MTLDADVIVDRRRLRRKLTFWRVLTFLILIGLVIAGAVALTDLSGPSKRSDHIARLAINGMILDDRKQLELIKEIGKSSRVQAVIVSINSPGGSTTGGESLYNALKALSRKKPIVSEIRTVGTSAGYMVALASDHIVARYNSITGSIGVLFQFGNVEKLLETVGVQMEAVKSAPLKAEPDFYSNTTPEARAMLAGLVGDSYDWFVKLVAERRELDEATARQLANGSIYSGYRAKENGLIDTIGGEETAVAWLEAKHKIASGLPVIEWKPKAETENLPFGAQIGKGLANSLINGLPDATGLIPHGLSLDGLVSVWQAPDAANNSTASGGGQ